MRTRVQRWGHSLAVRIPKTIAGEAGLEENGPIDLLLVDGQVVIEPLSPCVYTLDQAPGRRDRSKPAPCH